MDERVTGIPGIFSTMFSILNSPFISLIILVNPEVQLAITDDILVIFGKLPN